MVGSCLICGFDAYRRQILGPITNYQLRYTPNAPIHCHVLRGAAPWCPQAGTSYVSFPYCRTVPYCRARAAL